MNKKFVALISSVVMLGSSIALAACGDDNKNQFTVAYLSGGRGETYVERLYEEFQKTDVYKDYLKEKGLEDLKLNVIKGGADNVTGDVRNALNTGTKVDVLFLNFGMTGVDLTESLVRSKQLTDLTSLLDEKVYGEETTLGDKLVPGLLENYTTKPYGDGKVYTLPAFYSPTGLWYDASRFNENGTDGKYKLPTTWEEFWALGDELNDAIEANGNKVDGEHPALFTYPTAGYFDVFIYAAVAGIAGEEKFLNMLGYTDGIWEDADIKNALSVVVKLRNYLEPNTVAQANTDFKKNQQAVIGTQDGISKGTALFIPNGDWLPSEMSASTPKDYKWGFMALPKKDASSKSYVNTFLENVYLHKDGAHGELAKEFLLYYFSDTGAKIVAEESKAIIPTQDALKNAKENKIPDSTIELYNAYNGNGAVSGSFVATDEVPGLKWSDVLFNDLNDKVFNSSNASKTDETLLNEWIARLEEASDKLRAKIIK